MTGYSRSLAARALGQPASIRPRASLRGARDLAASVPDPTSADDGPASIAEANDGYAGITPVDGGRAGKSNAPSDTSSPASIRPRASLRNASDSAAPAPDPKRVDHGPADLTPVDDGRAGISSPPTPDGGSPASIRPRPSRRNASDLAAPALDPKPVDQGPAGLTPVSDERAGISSPPASEASSPASIRPRASLRNASDSAAPAPVPKPADEGGAGTPPINDGRADKLSPPELDAGAPAAIRPRDSIPSDVLRGRQVPPPVEARYGVKASDPVDVVLPLPAAPVAAPRLAKQYAADVARADDRSVRRNEAQASGTVPAPASVTASRKIRAPAERPAGPVAVADLAQPETSKRTRRDPKHDERSCAATAQNQRLGPVRPAAIPARTSIPPTAATGADTRTDIGAAPLPDVHIHIGRVELTAIAAPAASSRDKPAASNKMSLNDYLSRRNGRAS